jgi:NADH-quinone oxidoreductase subunit F
MDLRFRGAAPSDAEREALDAVLGSAPSAWTGGARQLDDLRLARSNRGRRDLLLPALHALQDRVGWISEGGLDEICRRLSIPPSEAYGVASFYALLSLEPTPARVVHVCEDVSCRMAGARPHESSSDGAVVKPSPCLGLCDRAPAALLVEAGAVPRATPFGDATPILVDEVMRGADPPPWDSAASVAQPRDHLVMLRRIGVADPTSLDSYVTHGGLSALRRAIELGPGGVIDAIERSGLVGRGGALFPTGRKWRAVAAQPPGPRYVVANADESEPGTFKDRTLMEGDPFAVLEGIAVAAFATGAEQAYVYVRGEYPIAAQRLGSAIGQLERARVLGDDLLGTGRPLRIEVRRGAGAYICGEETALFASIEGYRGEPRTKPPFPTEVGLFGKPTAANNIETLVCAALVIEGHAPDRRLLSVSGKVRRPGLYEVADGVRLRELIDLAGGVPDGRHVQAVLLGGAAGSFVGPHDLDVPLSADGVRAIGASLGSGVVAVIDDSVDLVDLVLRLATFFRDESCGQCVPCRVGTVRQEEVLHRLVERHDVADLTLLRDVGIAMRDASICGLGQTAYAAVESAVKLGVFSGVS